MFWVYSRCSRTIRRKSWALLVESVSILSMMTKILNDEQESTSPWFEWEKRTKVTHSTRLASTVTPRYTRLIFLSKYKAHKHCRARLSLPVHRSEQHPSCPCVNTVISDHWSANSIWIDEWIFIHCCESKKRSLVFSFRSLLCSYTIETWLGSSERRLPSWVGAQSGCPLSFPPPAKLKHHPKMFARG